MRMVYQCAECGEHFESKLSAIACHGEEAYQVTSCCGAELGEKTLREYPLGGQLWHIDYGVPCCIECLEALDE